MHLKKLVTTLLLIGSIQQVSSTEANPQKWYGLLNWTPSKSMPKLIAEARKRHAKRKLANYSAIDVKSISQEYKDIVRNVLNAKTPDQIHGLLLSLDKKIDSMPQDAKFLGAQLLMFKEFRGIIYRMIPMVSKHNATHSFLRNQVKVVASNMRIYLPLQHWEAGFDYLVEPYLISKKEKAVVDQFEDISAVKNKIHSGKFEAIVASEQFQDYVGKHVYSAFARATNIIEDLNFEKPIVWDNRIAFGSDSYKDDFEETRYRKVGEAERLLALSSLHMGMHYIKYLISYDVKGSLSLAKDIGKLYGIDGFALGETVGVPSYKWVKQVQKSKYDNIGRIRPGGKNNMAQSYNHLKEGVKLLRIAREELRNEPADKFFVIDPSRLNVWDENIEKQFKHIECLTDDQKEDSPSECAIRSAITGHTVVVDLKNFYLNPPKNLKIFLPTDWKVNKGKVRRKIAFKKEYTKHGVTYPNYTWGTPTKWDISAYKKHVFPNINKSSEIPEYIRTLRQSFGGEAFGVPMAIFVE